MYYSRIFPIHTHLKFKVNHILEIKMLFGSLLADSEILHSLDLTLKHFLLNHNTLKDF